MDTSEAADIRRRAFSGALMIAGRGTALRALGFLGTLALARLLTPAEFGIAALGLAVSMLAGTLADGGMGASLIRARNDPEAADLKAISAFQLAAILAILVLAATPLLLIGEPGHITLVMLLSLPVATFRLPTVVGLERRLRYGPIVAAELAETVIYYGWAITTVAIGWGVWGLATAAVARSLSGTILLICVAQGRLLIPRWDWQRAKRLLRFGLAFQGTALVGALRFQVRDAGIGAIGGLTALGVWSLAFRLLQVPMIMFESLWRLSYPALARLLETGEDVRHTLERAMRMSAAGGGLLVTIALAPAPALVPIAFGPEWSQASDVAALAGIGLLVSSPVAIVAIGYLFAVGEAALVLRLQTAFVVFGLAITFGLLPVIGLLAAGIGWLAQSVLGALLLARALHQHSGARVFRPTAVPTLVPLLASVPGWIVATQGTASMERVIGSASLALGLFLALMLVLEHELSRSIVRLFARALRREGGAVKSTPQSNATGG